MDDAGCQRHDEDRSEDQRHVADREKPDRSEAGEDQTAENLDPYPRDEVIRLIRQAQEVREERAEDRGFEPGEHDEQKEAGPDREAASQHGRVRHRARSDAADRHRMVTDAAERTEMAHGGRV